ncbi:hypothetical protein Tco_0145188 [Tanacetum coccineum]
MAKIEWLDVGDSNSAYFHKSVKARNQWCRVDTVINANNIEFSGPNVAKAFVSHYENFLGNSTICDNLNTEGLFHNKVSDVANINMVCPITDDEIKTAMFDIGDDRAPGPDGYTSAFFKKAWDIIGLEEVVSMNQSAYILRRNISDNILTTQELMHNYHQKRGAPRCAFKVDIHKAYDTVDWHDLFLFSRGDVDSAQVIIDSLYEFKATSGLVPSIPKSTAYFGNVSNHVKMGREGYQLQNNVDELVSDGGWSCPQAWLLKAPNLNQPLAKSRKAKSIIGKLLLAAASYFIWIERNNRLFKNVKRKPEELRDIVMVTVRLKLLTFRFKNTAMVNRLLNHWKMASNFRLYGS